MTTGITPLTFSEKSYITTAEYKSAPTAQQTSNLVVGGNEAAQDAELAAVILRASSFMDEYLNQNLVATQTVETQRIRMTPQGYISLHPNNNPILALVSFQYGSDPNNLQTLTDPSTAWFENSQVIIPLSQLATTYTSQGPLAFGGTSPFTQIFTKYTYIAGYVNTIAGAASAGATSITVTDGTGIIAGQQYLITDGSKTERVTVASNYTFGSTTVPLTSALAYTHLAGASFSNMPGAIKQACILLTTAFLKVRGDSAMMMSMTQRPVGQVVGSDLYGSNIKIALDMIDKYRRVR
jgi:hypothetical protein